ncbi:MAG: glycosyltransferase family 39 protein [bacterium]
MFSLQKIFNFFRKNFTKKGLIFISLILIGFFATRLINLDKFPIFTDEGIYINWAKIAKTDATWRFISLTDGRQPLQTWFTIFFLKFFPNNLLLAGRLFSVTGGFVALTGLFSLCFYLFGKKAAYWSSMLYIFTPYFLFYDRLALVDSFVNAGFIWILFLSIYLARNLRLDIALLLGLSAGIFSLSKSSVRMFIGLSALSPILFLEKNVKKFFDKLSNYGFLYIIVLILSLVIYNVQRLSPYLHFVAEKNKTFVMTFQEFLKTPFLSFFHNIKIIPLYVAWESAFILPIIGLVGLVFLYKKDWRLATYLLLWILLPYMAVSFFAKVVFPRYLNFFGTSFLILAVYFLTTYKKKELLKYIVIVLFASFLIFDTPILFATNNIPFPPIDRGQYIEGTSAGYGVKEIIEYAREKSKEKPVIIVAEGNFGVVGDMLNASLKPTDKINIKAYWPLDGEHLWENQKYLNDNFVFVVFSHRTEFPGIWPIDLIKKYEKPGGQSAFYFFKLKL